MLRLQIFREVIVFLPPRWQPAVDEWHVWSRLSNVLWCINAGASKLCSCCLQSSNAPLGAYKVKAAGLYPPQQSQSCSFITLLLWWHTDSCAQTSARCRCEVDSKPQVYLTYDRNCQITVYTTQFQFSVSSQKVLTLAGVTMVFLRRETSRYLNDIVTHAFLMKKHSLCLLCHL